MAIETKNNKMLPSPTAIWCITPNGKILALKIKTALKDSTLFVSKRIWQNENKIQNAFEFEKLSEEILCQFNKFSGHIFIFSTGIVVRIIAPLLNSKILDPAVVVVDDNGTHAISLISGHLGGANELSKKIAHIVCGTPVITTATDTNKLPAIDLIAKNNDLFIETPQNIKLINMAFLMGKPVSLFDPFGFVKNNPQKNFFSNKTPRENSCEKIFCTYKTKNVSRETLILRPLVLSVGIGCNRGTSCKDLKQFLFKILKKENLSVNSIYEFATVDIKKDETGLLDLSKEMKIPIVFFDKKKLNSVKTIKTPSQMVEKHLGIKSVCEAAAILSANNGNLIVTKNKNKDVTLAVAIKK